jgi:hypothetical protein
MRSLAGLVHSQAGDELPNELYRDLWLITEEGLIDTLPLLIRQLNLTHHSL